MKTTPKNYAQVLVEALESDQNPRQTASNFLDVLYKNKQEKSLKLILESLDEAYAQKNNMISAKVYSNTELSENDLVEIGSKLEAEYKKKILIKNIVKTEKIAGITVEVEGKLFDYSLSGKLEILKKKLTS